MSQQMDGPARYQKPEESGMPHAQPTAQAMTALLRNAASVDAQKTKSLCCAAAGITALARSTTEVHTPHEKLRGAARPRATLNAQSGPLAQLAQGYKSLTNLNSSENLRQLSACACSHSPQCGHCSIFSQLHVIAIAIIECRIIEVPLSMLTHVGHCMAQLQPTKCDFRERNFNKTNLPQKGLTFFERAEKFCDDSVLRTFKIDITICIHRNLGGEFRYTIYLFEQLVLSSCCSVSTFGTLSIRYPHSNQNCSNRSNRLNPGWRIFFGIKRIKQDKQRPPQHPYRHKDPNDPNTGDPHLWRHAETFHALWLPAIQKKRACPFQSLPSMKEAA